MRALKREFASSGVPAAYDELTGEKRIKECYGDTALEADRSRRRERPLHRPVSVRRHRRRTRLRQWSRLSTEVDLSRDPRHHSSAFVIADRPLTRNNRVREP